ncbi:hypothetical protein [Streptomyces parvus]|uniref:hypothetical protein n=1 Tax=Streptomyces parvus TaxID=66428 RepID=UPI0035D8870D
MTTAQNTAAHLDLSSKRLVIIDADVHTARTAHALGCHTVFVQQPGSPVPDLVDDQSGYYSVNFTGERFPEFVEEVLSPLAPAAVVSLSSAGLRPAALANAQLGTPGTPPAVVDRLTEEVSGGQEPYGDEVILHAFSTDGVHRLLAVTPRDPVARGSTASDMTAQLSGPWEHAAALASFLDAAGLRNGPSRTRARLSGRTVRVLSSRLGFNRPEEVDPLRALTGLDLTRWALGWPLGLREEHCGISARSLETNTR